jgi:ABC-2 type transport system permease protein
MIKLIVIKEIFFRKWAIFNYSLFALLFLLLYISIYPSVSKDIAQFEQLFQSYPKALLEAFNIAELKLTTLEGYIAAEHFSFIWPLMAILLTLSVSVTSIAGEIESKTITLLLSLPISRRSLLAGKFIATIAASLVFCIVSILPIWPLAELFGFSVSAPSLLKTFAVCVLFMIAIASLGLFVASFVKQKGHAYMIIGGILMMMYVANIVAGLVDNLDFMRYGSIFNYFEPGNILTGSAVPATSIIVLGVFSLLTVTGGMIKFLRRDVAIQ